MSWVKPIYCENKEKDCQECEYFIKGEKTFGRCKIWEAIRNESSKPVDCQTLDSKR